LAVMDSRELAEHRGIHTEPESINDQFVCITLLVYQSSCPHQLSCLFVCLSVSSHELSNYVLLRRRDGKFSHFHFVSLFPAFSYTDLFSLCQAKHYIVIPRLLLL